MKVDTRHISYHVCVCVCGREDWREQRESSMTSMRNLSYVCGYVCVYVCVYVRSIASNVEMRDRCHETHTRTRDETHTHTRDET